MSAPRLTIFGMCPNGTAGDLVRLRPGLALTGGTGRRLAGLLGWDWRLYLRRTTRMNVLPVDSAARWPSREAERRAEAIGAVAEGPVLLLGFRVCVAFGLAWDPDRLLVAAGPRGRLVRAAAVLAIPHPSGRCRWYNVPENRERARLALGELTRWR